MGNLVINPELAGLLSPEVQSQLGELSEEKQQAFAAQFEGQKKTVLNAYLLLLFCGGLVWFYLGNMKNLIIYWITCGGCGIWALYLLIKLPEEVKKVNDAKALEIMATL